MELYGLGKSNMVFYGLCDLVRFFGYVYFTMLMYFLVRSQMVLFGYVWYCMALRSYAQFLCLFSIRMFSRCYKGV